jgi:hypothetical protein
VTQVDNPPVDGGNLQLHTFVLHVLLQQGIRNVQLSSNTSMKDTDSKQSTRLQNCSSVPEQRAKFVELDDVRTLICSSAE